jgi:hypothetical protein
MSEYALADGVHYTAITGCNALGKNLATLGKHSYVARSTSTIKRLERATSLSLVSNHTDSRTRQGQALCTGCKPKATITPSSTPLIRDHTPDALTGVH